MISMNTTTQQTMQPVKIDHHRNGICGNPFSVGIVKKSLEGQKEQTFLIVQFDQSKESTAVFDLDLLKQGIIEFGKNSWRGDQFADEFENLAEIDSERKFKELMK